MKYTIGFIATVVFLCACKKEDNKTTTTNENKNANLKIEIQNMVGSEQLVMAELRYTNASNNLYSVDMLKYYISNITLHKKSGGEQFISVYELIDASNKSSCTFNAGSIGKTDYDSMTFYIGVDPTRNHSGVQDGDLDVSKGMFWTWNTGYIFFKHEGQYKNSSDQTKSLIGHLGTDNGYSKVTLPINLELTGDKIMSIKFDLNSVFTSPVNIDFNVDNNRQSMSAGDAQWISNMRSNLADAFSFIKAE